MGYVIPISQFLRVRYNVYNKINITLYITRTLSPALFCFGEMFCVLSLSALM